MQSRKPDRPKHKIKYARMGALSPLGLAIKRLCASVRAFLIQRSYPLNESSLCSEMVNLPGVGPHSHDIRECRFVRIGECTKGYRDGLNYTAVKGDVIHTDNLVEWFDSIPIHQF